MRVSRRYGAFLGGLVAAALVAGAHRSYQYTQTDAGFCTDCHRDTAGLAGEAVRSHPGLRCQECHPTDTSTAAALFLQSAVHTEPAEVSAHGSSPSAPCEGCHATGERPVGETAGHAAHLKGEKATACVECHRETAHEGRPGNPGCIECHPDDDVKSSPMAEVHCLTCHDYLAPEKEAARRPAFGRCESCHAGTDRKAPPIELHAEMPCTLCHQPHREPFTVSAACENCHDAVAHTHPEVEEASGPPAPVVTAPGGSAYCTACHGPHDDWTRAVERCQGCHEDVLLEALPTRARRATLLGDELLDALAEQAAHVSCVECHPAHVKGREGQGAMRAVTKDCFDCHEDAKQPKTHHETSCGECHSPHTPRPRDCADCHKPSKTEHGTADCVECHRVHEDAAFQRPRCEECHDDLAAKAVPGGHAKSVCEDCHAPHKTAPKPCAECHREEVAASNAVRGRPKEHRECAECHAPHTWKAPVDTCKRCHEEQVAKVAKIEKRPPSPGRGAGGGGGHSECKACHAGHQVSVDVAKTCGDCHKEQMAKAVVKHRDCQECHDEHDGDRKGQKDCRSCHPDEFKSAHVKCDGCHKVHTPAAETVPACGKCHAPGGGAKLAVGLHTIKEHQKCADCHSPHGPSRGDRATCSTAKCHADQAKHEPAAPVCNGCHVFRAGE